MRKQNQDGFTLVELAIVMIVIGLLITGVLKGQELIENAQISATVRQVEGYKGAVAIFRDTYGAIPGDMSNPLQRLPNCDASGGSMCGVTGNANGRVDHDPSTIPAGEGLRFFLHLAAADLITGVNSLAAGKTPIFGEHLPDTAMGDSGFYVGYNNGDRMNGEPPLAEVSARRPGHYLAIADVGAAATHAVGSDPNNVPLTPRQAENIDRKLDDGLPNIGTVRSAGQAGQNCVVAVTQTIEEETISRDIYSTATVDKACGMYISFF